MAKLDNRFALITGASSGIGRGVALAFAREGAHVALNYPHAGEQDATEALAGELRTLGRRALAVQADVSDEQQVQDMVRQVEAEFGRIDILVNNAGIASMSPVHEMPTEMWDQLMSINLRGVFLCTRAVLPGMYDRDDGKIINTASQLAYKGAPAFSHYTAAKAAMISFTRSLSLEIGSRNISANCVAPGTTDTPILANVDPQVLDQIRASIPKGRIAPIDDIVPAYVFLASDDSRHFVGQTLSPNGGDVFL
ncbi:3-oxoacyl-ACP reductase FabG [Methylonatrum kenyense]|uniref:SDR family NAD(P)-dependent oxidoreductase n=1 Tax=Methylonatrum kenyense TaxID=455253 RepID=UPI0020BD478F|nr:3-oxoacyl-ACP reductase family protein [Methylonatrum kenyense]MCK8514923.1 3-oxoacyl-ACP reductase FabG [Methylonatrum kenyense]